MKKLLIALFAASCLTLSAADEAKKLLVVTVTKGIRHSTIGKAEKVLAKLADDKKNGISVDYVRNDEDMKSKMTAEKLKEYAGFIFANTTGVLPLPDKQAFLNELKNGKAFI